MILIHNIYRWWCMCNPVVQSRPQLTLCKVHFSFFSSFAILECSVCDMASHCSSSGPFIWMFTQLIGLSLTLNRGGSGLYSGNMTMWWTGQRLSLTSAIGGNWKPSCPPLYTWTLCTAHGTLGTQDWLTSLHPQVSSMGCTTGMHSWTLLGTATFWTHYQSRGVPLDL